MQNLLKLKSIPLLTAFIPAFTTIPTHNRYYRFVDAPVSSKHYNQSRLTGASTTQLSMIVSDESFENKVEIELDSIHLCPSFVCNDKLYFINKNAYNRNSDSLYFDIYKLEFP